MDPKICPNCSNENRMDAKFCKNCGFDLMENDNQSKSPVKFCPQCKNPNRSSAKFCSVCGHSFIEIAFTGILSTGTILVNRYEVINLIKSGGMGAVYKVRDHRMLELCAIKELIATFSTEEQQEYSLKRFNEEGKMLANLNHANLPRVTDLFIERGRYYLVMDFIDGKDLDTILKERKKLSTEETLTYTLQILDVLDYLHTQNPPIIYRDLKPANIMIRTRDQRAMLIDFGIARTVEEEGKKTKIGTPQYSPLEQFKGMVEPRSDIYSLGATMHHLITGIMPAPMAFQFDPVTKFIPELSKELEKIIEKAVQTDIDARYSSAREMMGDVKKILERDKKLPTVEMAVAKVPSREKTQKEKIEIPQEEVKIIEFPAREELASIATGKEKISIIKRSEKTKKLVSSIIPCDEKLDIHPSSSEMILIPAGYFWMGGQECEYDSNRKGNFEINRKGQHRIYTEAFYMDITPVTNEQYRMFVEETGYNSEGDWEKYFTEGKEGHPVVNVTWYDADSYARWAKKRLPSEAEWEKASRGGDGRKWPWGNLWDEKKLNSRESKQGNTTDVKQYPRGDSIYGIMDTVGNVWEWTSDWYFPYPYEGPYISVEGDKKALRGGSYNDPKDKCTSDSRNWGFPENKSAFRGFRCAKDVS
ncbi:MAG: SUMF1/EgtB/PvdO family nonheme iron enzyme [Candidatus Eremiobacterota bacterium]